MRSFDKVTWNVEVDIGINDNGYGVILQLYGDNEEKGIKSIEAPKGDTKFYINMKLEMIETIDGKQVTTDITKQSMPQLWNYKINIGEASENPAYGNI